MKEILESKCARLEARLDTLRAEDRAQWDDAEYMAMLYDYREATRKRLELYTP